MTKHLPGSIGTYIDLKFFDDSNDNLRYVDALAVSAISYVIDKNKCSLDFTLVGDFGSLKFTTYEPDPANPDDLEKSLRDSGDRTVTKFIELAAALRKPCKM